MPILVGYSVGHKEGNKEKGEAGRCEVQLGIGVFIWLLCGWTRLGLCGLKLLNFETQ